MDIEAELAHFRGDNVQVLEALAQRHPADAALLRRVFEAGCLKPKLRAGVVWLLSYWGYRGQSLATIDLDTVLDWFEQAADWHTPLYILQLIPKLTIPAERHPRLYHLLLAHLGDANKFVRAWAYNGLHSLARRFPQYEAEVHDLLEVGIQTEVAAVKAQIRAIRQGAMPRLPRR